MDHSKGVVKVHPVVLFSILDHYIRRSDDQVRVVGTLMGTRTAMGNVVVKSCFPVPHAEGLNGDRIGLAKEHLKNMLDMHLTVYPNEEIVGWYATSLSAVDLINNGNVILQDEFSKLCENPLHLVVDTFLADNTVAIKGFLGVPITLGGDHMSAAFTQLKVEVAFSEPEKIGVDVMIKAKSRKNIDPTKQVTDMETVHSEIDDLQQSLSRLLSLLETVSAYVDDVVAKRRQPNPKLGTMIASVVSMVPRLNHETFAKSFRSSVEDLLMIVYLTNLTRTQLAVAENIATRTAK